ncbi:hypothetical protein DVT68_11090 [Dyella solisilvae]|uniref:DUF4239 domain-containing protein n=1 Tax=Dyella solisilvae TaxID=1920168 RepID=A0A370K999_9GAMM|nr:hypothetical protein [Dyella solisilvae]RDI99027.1 hypothetical protein DVT68_11090 [Dyella solisilvae]
MHFGIDHPVVVFVFTFAAMWIAGRVGMLLARWHRPDQPDVREAFNVVQGATLTLLGLIIGFTFSMAIGRYDQRKNYEEAEANAIGTEYVRLDLLPPAVASKVRPLLISYLDERIKSYETTDRSQISAVDARVNDLQTGLWNAITPAAHERPDPITALAVAGMNDVLNSQGYTQAAWWNRIPTSAWVLLVAIALGCNLLVGVGASRLTSEPALMLVLPLIIAVAFALIADIDSPRGGMIRVAPQNLHALRASIPNT